MPRSRKEKHYAKVHDMAQCWPVPPSELLWVGGTYARHPKYFPEHQKEHAWVYGRLRPLGIQPDTFLSKLHQAGLNRFAPIDVCHKARSDGTMVQQLPGTLLDTVRAGELWTYLENHQLHESLWYGLACGTSTSTTPPFSITHCPTSGIGRRSHSFDSHVRSTSRRHALLKKW